jgi:hypothetical protein
MTRLGGLGFAAPTERETCTHVFPFHGEAV